MGNQSSNRQMWGINNNQSMKDLLETHYNPEVTLEILEAANTSNMIITKVDNDGTIHMKGISWDWEYNVEITKEFMDKLVFREPEIDTTGKTPFQIILEKAELRENNEFSKYNLVELLNTVEQTPHLFKQNLKTIYFGKGYFTKYAKNACYYDSGEIHINPQFLMSGDSHLKGTIIHELAHNLDYNGGSHHNEFSYSLGFDSMIHLDGHVSNYSHKKAKQDYQEYGSYPEDFAEMMSMVGSVKLGGNSPWKTRCPTEQSRKGIRESEVMDGNTWKNYYKKAYEVGNKIWDAKSREEVTNILKNIEGYLGEDNVTKFW